MPFVAGICLGYVFMPTLIQHGVEIIALLIAGGVFWQSWETRRVVEVALAKERPFLELIIPENSSSKIHLKNIGTTPAYALAVSSIPLSSGESLSFDPLQISRAPILPGETREMWVFHKRPHQHAHVPASSVPLHTLKNFLKQSDTNPRVTLSYCDKDGHSLKRTLYLKVSGANVDTDDHVYVSTR